MHTPRPESEAAKSQECLRSSSPLNSHIRGVCNYVHALHIQDADTFGDHLYTTEDDCMDHLLHLMRMVTADNADAFTARRAQVMLVFSMYAVRLCAGDACVAVCLQ